MLYQVLHVCSFRYLTLQDIAGIFEDKELNLLAANVHIGPPDPHVVTD